MADGKLLNQVEDMPESSVGLKSKNVNSLDVCSAIHETDKLARVCSHRLTY